MSHTDYDPAVEIAAARARVATLTGGPAASGWRAIEERTRSWIEECYSADWLRAGAASTPHRMYDPDGRIRYMSSFQFQALLRKLKVFRCLDRLRFQSVLDVGAGFDAYPTLVRQRYGVPTVSGDLAHCINLPFAEPPVGKLDHAVTLSITRLPFRDDAFDVVMATEVLEHLVRPVEAIAEMMRVARRYVVLTSLEALSLGRRQRLWSRLHIDPREPHVERNFMLLHEIEAIFGPQSSHENLFYDPGLPASQFAPADQQAAVYAPLTEVPALSAALRAAARERGHAFGAVGVIILAPKGDATVAPIAADDAPLAEWLIAHCAEAEEMALQLAARVLRLGRDGALPDPQRPVAPPLLARLACPDCHGPLEPATGGLRCTRCTTRFATEYGVPILYPTRSPSDRELEDEARQRLCGDDRGRWRTVRALMRALRRRERTPGLTRRALWYLESRRAAS